MTDKVTTSLNGKFTAAELEDVIKELSIARARMEPAVPLSPPTSSEASIVLQENASFTVRTLIDGGLRIWLRSEGIGWIAFQLSATRRQELLEFLGKKAGHTHTSH